MRGADVSHLNVVMATSDVHIQYSSGVFTSLNQQHSYCTQRVFTWRLIRRLEE